MSALAARVQANEGIAKSSLKALVSAVEIYRNTIGVYPNDLATLGESYIAPDLVAGQKSGYNFVLKSGNDGNTFTCTAVPVKINYTGNKSYCTAVLNTLYVYDNAPALSADGSTCPAGGSTLTG